MRLKKVIDALDRSPPAPPDPDCVKDWNRHTREVQAIINENLSDTPVKASSIANEYTDNQWQIELTVFHGAMPRLPSICASLKETVEYSTDTSVAEMVSDCVSRADRLQRQMQAVYLALVAFEAEAA